MHWLDKHARFRNQLSPYLDSALSAAETRRLEAHLAACEICRAELDDLRTTVAAVHELPRVDAPRSFAVTPRMLEPRAAVPGPTSAPPLALGMRLASAGVAIVLAFVVIGDLSDGGGGGVRESADESRTQTELSAAQADQEEAGGGAAVPAPAVTGPAEAFDLGTEGRNDIAACPSGVAGGTGSGGTAGGAGGPSSGGGSGTGTAGETAAASPTPQPAATLESTVACEGQAIAGAVTPTTSAPEPARDAAEENLSAEGALEAEDDGGVSTLRVVEIALAGALVALLAAVAVELALRRRAA